MAAEVLSAGGAFRFGARGWCMRPFLFPGDTVTVGPVNSSELKQGMIVLYRGAWGGLACHRVVRIDSSGGDEAAAIFVRPDAAGPDELIKSACVLGRVVSVERDGKRYPLDHGRLAWAGLLRVRSTLGGLLIAAPARVPRYIAARAIPRLQRFRSYRRVAARCVRDRVRVRVATTRDVVDLGTIYGWDALSPDSTTETRETEALRRMAADGCHVFASLRGKPAGAASLRRFPGDEDVSSDWWLFDLIVRVRYRGAGIGERLVRVALETARHKGAARVNVRVESANVAALALYGKLGFEQASTPAPQQNLDRDPSACGLRQVVLSRSLP